MRAVKLLCDLLAEELKSDLALTQLRLRISQGDQFGWLVLVVRGSSELALQATMRSLSPFYKGEGICGSGPTMAYSATEDFILRETDINAVFAPATSDGMRTDLETELADGTDLHAVIVVRLRRIDLPCDAALLKSAALSKTWFAAGIVPEGLRNRSVDIKVGAQALRLVRNGRDAIATAEVEGILLTAFVRDGGGAGVEARIFGFQAPDGITLRIDKGEFLSAIGFTEKELYGYEVDLGVTVEVFTNDVPSKSSLLSAISKSSPWRETLQNHVRNRLTLAMEKAAASLNDRREALASRRIVFLQPSGAKKIELGPEPTNENETLIMAGKLQEALRQHFQDFTILEHTGQIGIDGLLRIKAAPGELVRQGATVEYEFQLMNFFRHGHPVRLTDFIICWAADGVAEGVQSQLNNGPEVRLSKQGWKWLLHLGDRIITVLPLREFPSIGCYLPD